MITDVNALMAAVGGHEEEKPVTNQMREDFNKYVAWLDKRGMKGHPSLDKNNLGNNMLAKYIKETPGTSLTLDSVIPIQNEFTKYRNWSLDQISQGKAAFGEGVTEENYLRDLTKVDGIPGQRTTSYTFPKQYLETFVDNKPVGVVDQGFATVK